MKRVKVAAAQISPIFMNKKATTDKACHAIEEAAAKGARLIVFPEAFIPNYPDWVWIIPGNKKPLMNDLYINFIGNAVTIPDETTRKLCSAAKKFKINVVIGINERNSEASNSTLYNTILYIDENGKILGKHRKLIPTGNERLIWGQGDGSTLEVYQSQIGKLGGLICWENYMPLARYTMYARGVQIYVAPTWDSSDAWLISLRHIAREGGMYVIGVCSAIQINAIPNDYEFKKLYPETKSWVNIGNSCIIDPQGEFVIGPVKEKEQVLYAEINHDLTISNKWIFDVAGHYARPDVFEFKVNTASQNMMDYTPDNGY